jgi:predicted  nucleic acid-binding Zn-ribbon protein
MVGTETPSSPPHRSNGFGSLQEELDYYKTAYETLDAELQEFQSSSKELEAELERDVEESEKRERKLQEKVEKLGFEAEEWKVRSLRPQ